MLLNIPFLSLSFANERLLTSSTPVQQSFFTEPFGMVNTFFLLGILIALSLLVFMIWIYLYKIQQNKTLQEAKNIKQHMGVLLNSSINEIYIFDKNSLKFTDLSKGALKNLGYRLDEIKKLTAVDIKPEYSFKRFREVIKPLIEKKLDILVFETIHQRKDGSTYPVEVHLQLMESDNVEGQFMAIILDISERKKAELEILKSNETIQKLSLAVEQSPNIIIITNAKGKIEYVNPAFTESTGYSREEVLNKNPSIIKSGEMPDEFYKDLWETIQAGKTWSGVFHNRRSNGELYWDEAKISPIKNIHGKITHYLGVQSDITEKKQIEQQLRRSQKMDALGKLTGGIAHDYNNMLNVILGYTELLEMIITDDVNEKAKEFIKEIQHATDRGTMLTKKLLSFSRQESAEPENVDVNQLLLDTQNMLEKTLTARINLEYQLADSIWPVYLDKGDLEDAILNMCINSMHAMPDGGDLTITTFNRTLLDDEAKVLNLPPGKYVQLSLSDNGCGINEEVLSQIFDPFFTTKGELGTGLGLTQVYGFVKRTKGAISIDSSLNEGTYILIYFPRYFSTTEQNEIINDEISDHSGSEKILVVDDETALCELSKNLLNSKGYQVLVAESGKDALDILENNNVDLILSDVIMPNMDGYKLAAKVRDKYPDVKIQLASGFDDDKKRTEEDEVLFKNILHKPYTATSLFEAVRKLLDE